VDFREVRSLGRRLAGARHTRLGIDDDVGVRQEQPGLDQRREGEQRRRGVAPGVGDQPRACDLAALTLREAVGDTRRKRVRLRIPLRQEGVVVQTECSREVDDADAGIHERRRQLGGGGVGQRQEHDVGLVRERLGRERHDGAVPQASQRRQPARRCAGLARRHRRRERNGGMPRQQAQQLLAGEAGRAGNRHARASGSVSGCLTRLRRIGLHNCMHRKE
jgi:hypothetical protein